jgi:hypothetical protein
MAKRLTVLVLILALGGSAVAGPPAHAGDPSMMSCCKAARSHDGSPAAQAARLCCAVNCPEPAPTAPAFSLQRSPLAALLHPSAVEPPAVVPASPSFFKASRIRPPDSQPTYIRHLALLI